MELIENNKENSQNTEKTIKGKKHRKKYFFLTILILIVIPAYRFYRFTQKSAEGVIKTTTSNTEVVKLVENVPETFSGKYLTFMYGNKYVLKTHDDQTDASGIILERAYLSQIGAISQKIGLTVRNFPSRNFSDCPDYKMRELNSKKYKKETFSEGKVDGIVFVSADDDPFERTYFLLHNDYLAIIAVSAPAMPDETLNKEANQIAKSVEWLK